MKFNSLTRRLKRGAPLLAVLIDPDKFNPELVKLAGSNKVDCFLVGGSRLEDGDVKKTVKAIKRISRLPVVLFPGDETQLTGQADGLLLLSLLSGRNPEYLIGKHITAAPIIKKMNLPHLPTAYILLGGSRGSSTELVTGTGPLDAKNTRHILNTALAAEQLGFRAIYLEAGSGAEKPVSPSLIRLLKKNVSLPLIVGGGLTNAARVTDAVKAGANMIVVGNALERDMNLLPALSKAIRLARNKRPA